MAKKKAATATAAVTLAGIAESLESHWRKARGLLILVAMEAFDEMRMELCEQSPNLPAFSDAELKSHALIESELGFLPFFDKADWRDAAVELNVWGDPRTVIDDDFAMKIGKGIRRRIAKRERDNKNRSLSSPENMVDNELRQERALAQSSAVDKSSPISDAEWTEWTLTKHAKEWFKPHIESPRGWTSFANRYREDGRIKNHPQSGPRKIKINQSLLNEYKIDFPKKD
jgi:hypothetical protein